MEALPAPDTMMEGGHQETLHEEWVESIIFKAPALLQWVVDEEGTHGDQKIELSPSGTGITSLGKPSKMGAEHPTLVLCKSSKCSQLPSYLSR
ncbi:hypothetical protein LEMLEM_LOCUS24328 [Lemmus lemmus]